MSTKMRFCAASFAITVILLAALWAFALVDLSSERYMPGQYGAFFEITSIDGAGVLFTFMGEEYLLMASPFQTVAGYLRYYRGFLPAEARLMEQLALELDNLVHGENEGYVPG